MCVVITHRLKEFGVVTSNGLASTRLQIYVELNDELTIPQLAVYQACLPVLSYYLHSTCLLTVMAVRYVSVYFVV